MIREDVDRHLDAVPLAVRLPDKIAADPPPAPCSAVRTTPLTAESHQEGERETLLHEVRCLLDSDPQLRNLDFIDVPYVTQCSRVKVLADPDR